MTEFRRYSVRLTLQPNDRTVTYAVVTSRGESMAVAMAASRLARREPDARLTGVEVMSTEEDFTVEPDDLIDNLERRYSIRLALQPGDRTATHTVVTSRGELKAAAMASLRHARLEPEDRIVNVELLQVEDDFVIDAERDLLSYEERA